MSRNDIYHIEPQIFKYLKKKNILNNKDVKPFRFCWDGLVRKTLVAEPDNLRLIPTSTLWEQKMNSRQWLLACRCAPCVWNCMHGLGRGGAFEILGQPRLYSVTLCVERACAASVVACVSGRCSLSLTTVSFILCYLFPFSGYSLFINGNASGFCVSCYYTKFVF